MANFRYLPSQSIPTISYLPTLAYFNTEQQKKIEHPVRS